jgi:phage-related minor tail protein
MFEWFTNLFQHAEDLSQMADQGIQSAQDITDAIPGEVDNQVADAVIEKVEQVTQQFEDIKNNIPGQGQ